MLDDAKLRQLVKDVEFKTLVIFDRMMKHRSARIVAKHLNYDVTTVFNHLAKLKDKTGDPLFVTDAGEKTPTPYAQSLHETVTTIIDLFANEFEHADTFRYTHQQRHFTLLIEDYFAQLVVPTFVDTVTAVGQDITLSLDIIPHLSDSHRSQKLAKTYYDMLASGDVDLIVSAYPTAFVQSDIKVQQLLSDTWVAAYDEVIYALESDNADAIECAAHLISSSILTALRHQPTKGQNDISSFTALLTTLGASTFCAEVPKRLLCQTQWPQLRVLDLDSAPYTLYQVWHTQQQHNPAHQWLRKTLKTVCQQATQGKLP